MATKMEALQAAGKNPPQGCLGKAKNDEPIFVLRGQDRLAAVLVDMWAELAALHGCDSVKVADAYNVAKAMRDWQRTKKSKFPD